MRCGPVLILSFICASVQGQQLLFENYSSEQGLSQNSCYTIAQDAEGFMWFGTQDGLNRYDGKEFRIFLPQNSIGRKLPSNYISSLLFDSSQNLLWIGTIRGACVYRASGDSLCTVKELYPYAAALEDVSVKKIVSFRRNEYWILTYNKGLLRLNTLSKTVSSYFDDDHNKVRVSSVMQYKGKIIVAVQNQLYEMSPRSGVYDVNSLLPDYQFPEIRELYSFNNRLWIGTLAEGCLYIDNNIEAANIHSFAPATGGVGSFIADATGHLWMGTRGNGVLRYNPATQATQSASHDRYDTRSLGKNFVLSLFSDRQGIVWCGLSGSGVAKYDPLKYQFRSITNEPINTSSLPDNMVFDIYRCKDGTYFTGTQNKGLVQWDPATDKFYSYPESSRFGAVSNTIYDITEDDDNNLWIASWGGLMQLDRRNKKLSFNQEISSTTARKLYSIIKLRDCDSLFITGENGPVFYSLKEKRWKDCPVNFMQANAFIGRFTYEDDDHILWICTIGAGLVRYDYRHGSFTIVDPIKQYSIYARHLLRDGELFWLATDNGILVYDPKQQKIIKHITLGTANASNVCYAIQKDKKGFFWVSTNKGLYRIDPHQYAIRNYDLGNGLSFLEYNTACALTEEDGTLIFGGTGGITRFNPSQLMENSYSPAPLITAIYINDSLYQPRTSLSGIDRLSLNYRQNFITIHFATTNFSNQNKNQFAYRLRNLTTNWSYSDNQGVAHYTSLPPGDYVFELRSANGDGVWNDHITSLTVTINPPWWQTWWFRISLMLVIAGIVTLMVRRRIGLIRHDAEMKQKIAESEMMALRAQMNPHFIFNCINSIDALIQSNDKYHATVYLNKFAKLIRNILDSSKQNSIPLRRDLETLQLFIDLEQLRNENKFAAEIKVDESLLQDDYKIPALIIQPYVENAILHGLRNRTDNNGRLLVSVQKQNGQIRYTIEDNGVGREAAGNGKHAEKQSYGMEMSVNRVKLFNKEETAASVTVTDLYENELATGTRVEVLLNTN
jgi:ligand-binding sensor domain-containing protein/anti-sigma regulatory factor (Ser/Thr protein kinase)